MGFDVGKLLGNLLLSFFSQRGHERAPGERDAYRRWILATTEQVWTSFAQPLRRAVDGLSDRRRLPRPAVRGPGGPRVAARGAGELHAPAVR